MDKGINIKRMKYIRHGYINQKQLQEFLGVGKRKAKLAYDEITKKIEKEGTTTDVLGIPIYRVLEYIGLSEEDIRRFADDEQKELVS